MNSKTPACQAVSLNHHQVCNILQDWLNANLLRIPHQVIDIDYQYDRDDLPDTAQFNIFLAPAADPQPMEAPPADAIPAPATKSTHNTNGRQPSIDRATGARILQLRSEGLKAPEIADQLGLGKSTVYSFLATVRKAAARMDAADSDGNSTDVD